MFDRSETSNMKAAIIAAVCLLLIFPVMAEQACRVVSLDDSGCTGRPQWTDHQYQERYCCVDPTWIPDITYDFTQDFDARATCNCRSKEAYCAENSWSKYCK